MVTEVEVTEKTQYLNKWEEFTMRFKKLKMSMAMAAMSMMMLLPAAPVFASTSDTWSVNYYKGAPTTTANPIDYAYVEYYYKYKAMAYDLTGSSDRTVIISNANMTTQYIKPSATTRTWTVKKGSSTVVTFKVVASGSESCYSTGMIKQDK